MEVYVLKKIIVNEIRCVIEKDIIIGVFDTLKKADDFAIDDGCYYIESYILNEVNNEYITIDSI